MAKNKKDMSDKEFAKQWKLQLDFVEESLKDKAVPDTVKSILTEWLADRGKELIDDKDINPNKR